jgi:hypothetical protein
MYTHINHRTVSIIYTKLVWNIFILLILSRKHRFCFMLSWIMKQELLGKQANRPEIGYFRSLTKTKTPWFESASELYRPTDRSLSANLVPTFADRRCHLVSVTNPYGRNLSFPDRSRYFFLQAAPQLYSRGWVDPTPGPLLLRKSGSAGNRIRTSGSVARNSDYYTTEAVSDHLLSEIILKCTSENRQSYIYI